MEITINIPKNDYVRPTQVRPEVVQHLCDAFIGSAENSYGARYYNFRLFPHGFHENTWLKTPTATSNYGWCFEQPHHAHGATLTKFYTAEVKTAFKAMIDAGYHMFKFYDGCEAGYLCDKKPFHEGAKEVFIFDEFID